VHDAIANSPSGARWLSSIHSTVAAATAGHGMVIAVGAAVLSAAIGVAGLLGRCARLALALSTAIAVVYMIIGQGMGGVLTGSGTDPGTGPLLILLAISIYALHRPLPTAEPLAGTPGVSVHESFQVSPTSVAS
jgi:hypothetical protein